ncbi:MAG: response regulator [Myxococcota bacterium]
MADSTSSQNLQTAIEHTRRRMKALAESSRDEPIEGLTSILEGLEAMLGQMEHETYEEERATRVELVLRGLSAVADVLDGQSHEAQPPPPRAQAAMSPELSQFIDAFRKEARKRLSEFSVSLMGLFNEQAGQDALEQSAGHLHAIRGGAAMLGLEPIAALSGLMEQVILSMRKLEPEARTWPTKALLRGFQMLEDAADDESVYIDPRAADEVRTELRSCLDSLSVDSPNSPPAQRLSPPAPAPALAPSKPPQRPAAPKPVLDGPMEQRILIVDDVETIAASVGFVLSELDVSLDIARNGEEALTMLKERPYSLVITDIAMPRLDGVALTRMIRSGEDSKDIPVILLTSLDYPSERDAGYEAGANDYIIKGSIGGGELVHRVQELLKIAPMVPADHEATRNERLRVLVAEDTETVAASIAFVLSEKDYDIVLTSDGREALTRLEREDFDLLISDWQMPSMSGFELIQHVRASARIKPLPIVLLTSLDSDKVRRDAYEAGADRFLVKGEVGGGILLDIVEELLEQDSMA